jgi:hypothetical protein
MSTVLKVAGVAAMTVAVGTAYVLIHEHRRKQKKEKKVAAGECSSSSAEPTMLAARLIEILEESAIAAYQLIEQVTCKNLQREQTRAAHARS